MKYVMFEVGDQKVPIIFPECLVHADVARGAHAAVAYYYREGGAKGLRPKPVSAGFITAMAVTGVHGLSESMGDLPHNPEDRRTINAWPYEQGRTSMLPNTEALVRLRVAQMLAETEG